MTDGEYAMERIGGMFRTWDRYSPWIKLGTAFLAGVGTVTIVKPTIENYMDRREEQRVDKFLNGLQRRGYALGVRPVSEYGTPLATGAVDLSAQQQVLQPIYKGISDITQLVQTVHSDLGAVKTEVNGLKQKVEGIEAEVNTLKKPKRNGGS